MNFDANVVGLNAINASGTLGISYNKASNTCALVCHMYSHNYDGTVTQLNASQPNKIGVRPIKH